MTRCLVTHWIPICCKREHEFAQLQSSLLNKAYNTLKDPLARAKYMLQLEGIQIEESASLEDPELLLEVLEMREELEQATSEDELKPVKQVNDGNIMGEGMEKRCELMRCSL